MEWLVPWFLPTLLTIGYFWICRGVEPRMDDLERDVKDLTGDLYARVTALEQTSRVQAHAPDVKFMDAIKPKRCSPPCQNCKCAPENADLG